MKKIYFFLIFTLFCSSLFAQDFKPNSTYLYAVKGTDSLYFDLYHPSQIQPDKPTILYIFGGGFLGGTRNDTAMISYYKMWVDEGFSLIAIDYRLALKNKKNVTLVKLANEDNPVVVAVADLYSATRYIIDNAKKLQVDADNIILIGSSAGAITAMTGIFDLNSGSKRNSDFTSQLPEGYQYAGVISFSGAVFSNEGKPVFSSSLPPILMLHGTADKIVNYNKVRILRYGLFGTKYLTSRLAKIDNPYYTMRFLNNGHEIATTMKLNFNVSLWFAKNMVVKKQKYQRDVYLKDPNIPLTIYSSWKPRDLYKK